MSAFDELCREFEQMPPEEYKQTLSDISGDLMPVLEDFSEEERNGREIFEKFLLASVVADGRLSEEEYELALPLFTEFFGMEADYEACCEFIRASRRDNANLKLYTNYMTDLFGAIDDYAKDDIITVCLLICAVDGKVSAKEKRWIRKLMD